MVFSNLSDWLAWQETLHPAKIELGLERVHRVALAMGLMQPAFPIITVAGTNGKGSCVAMLEAVLCAAGYRVGAYTSPHLLRYNERVRVNGAPAGDEEFCAAFERVDQARGEISLTYFEFGTLAAMDIFARAGLEVAILEVGMGGRLDAVNVWDADAALVTSVALDHQGWLGETREAIGQEKAGIFRAGRAAVVGERTPPASVLQQAEACGAPVFLLGRDYGATPQGGAWTWWGPQGRRRHGLPMPHLRGRFQLDNACASLMVLESLVARLPISAAALRDGLRHASAPGRFQILDGLGLRIVDVAHNPHAAAALAETLRAMPSALTHAVFAALSDKDIVGVARAMGNVIDVWHVAGLDTERGLPVEELAARLVTVLDARRVRCYDDLSATLAGAVAAAGDTGRVVAFGSFYTAAAVLAPSQRDLWHSVTPDRHPS